MGKVEDSKPPKAESGGAPKGSMSSTSKNRYFDAGKGSRRRVNDQDKYEENWEKIFGKKKKVEEEKDN